MNVISANLVAMVILGTWQVRLKSYFTNVWLSNGSIKLLIGACSVKQIDFMLLEAIEGGIELLERISLVKFHPYVLQVQAHQVDGLKKLWPEMSSLFVGHPWISCFGVDPTPKRKRFPQPGFPVVESWNPGHAPYGP